ncbi:hypothetical protein C4552_03440 [Candidatus Parcubacteria bacterium]|nr:MAG: hypothetical protein C4552_03440 [Candidatus Parcubacteria bacterium]
MLRLPQRKLTRYLLALLPLAILIGISLFISLVYTPERIVAYLGVENAYVLIFFTAIAGGFTTFNLVPYHLLLITLAVGGLNPLLLGVLATLGVTTGDSTSYFVGYQSRALLPEHTSIWFQRIYRIAIERPRLFMFVCFAYGCVIPASNDFLTIPAGIARVPFWRIMLPLVLGNAVFNISLAHLAPHAAEFLQYVFS